MALALGTRQGLQCHVGSWGWGCSCLLALPGCGQERGEHRGGPLLCVTLDFWPALPPPGLFPHSRGQRWLRSRGAVRGNENHVERPCGGTSLALGTPRTVPRKEGVTQSQGPLPPRVLSFGSWRQRWQHQGLWALLPRVWGQTPCSTVPACLHWCPYSASPTGAEPWRCGSRPSSSRAKPCGRCRRSMGSISPSRCGTTCRSGSRARHGRSGGPIAGGCWAWQQLPWGYRWVLPTTRLP